MPAPHNSQPLITSSLGGHFFLGFDKEIFPPSFTAWMSKPFFCKNPCLESRGYFNATMLLCYQCKNILIFGSNHKTSLCCKTETVQVAKSAPLIPGCWCPAPVWKFGDPGVPKAGAGVSGRLGATAGARNPRKSQAPVGRWPLG